MKYSAFLLVGATIALIGCGGDDRSGGRDGGGIIMLMDGGGGGGTDGGGGGGTDGGVMMGRECEQSFMAYPTEAGMRCSAATRDCMNMCMDGTCIQGCIDADTTEPLTDPMNPMLMIDCGFCIGYNQFYCLDSRGSHAEVAAFNCCVEDNCPAGSAATCPQTSCATQIAALQGSAAAMTCLGIPTSGDYAVCFAM